MTQFEQFLFDLKTTTQLSNDRQGVTLCGSSLWSHSILSSFLQVDNNELQYFWLGVEDTESRRLSYRSGQQLLGRECDLLIYDCHAGFDANSFNAALGTLVGGGLLVVLTPDLDPQHTDFAVRWFHRSLLTLIVVNENVVPPEVTTPVYLPFNDERYAQQLDVISKITRMARGRKHRPLVITADRGRGKSSALGLAVAELFVQSSINIVITAPTVKAISSVFYRVIESIDGVLSTPTSLSFRGSTLRFVAADELVRDAIKCDLLLVDEASSIPLSMLCTLAGSFGRVVFSTTIHGYEGSGRGFSLKFIDWLLSQFPNGRTVELDVPIRWHSEDTLEKWQYKTFLLNCELPILNSQPKIDDVAIHAVCKSELVDSFSDLRAIFSLLINAHYQTTPSDLFHMLSDPAVTIKAALIGGVYVGCLLSVAEGGLEQTLVTDIGRGIRRPKGHLVPVTLANQLGFVEQAALTCERISRISIHPQAQSLGFGSALISEVVETSRADYVASSFGASGELINFWRKNNFRIIKLGSHRDKASGCYSVLVVSLDEAEWLDEACQYYGQYVKHALSNRLISVDIGLIRALLFNAPYSLPTPFPFTLVGNYLLGGATFEAVAVWLSELTLLQCSLDPTLVSDLLIAKLLQHCSWTECTARFGLSGRKQIESQIRIDAAVFISDLHCKMELKRK
jgi:tRNA(Met) cytidine acetyltransferase